MVGNNALAVLLHQIIGLEHKHTIVASLLERADHLVGDLGDYVLIVDLGTYFHVLLNVLLSSRLLLIAVGE